MTTAEAYGELRALGQPVVETGEAAARLKTSQRNASRILRATAEAGLTQQIRRGLWAVDPDVLVGVVAPYLTAPFPAYVSLWSALSAHDMIEQLPRSTSVASLDRAREIETGLGAFAIHHLAPEVFGGFEGSPRTGYLATPEKALFDVAYVRAPRGGGVYFPELTLPRGFEEGRLQSWLGDIPSRRIRTIVARGLETALAGAERSV